MHAAYVTITIIASVFTATAAVTYLAGHAYPKAQATMKRVPHSWLPFLGGALAAGALGLLAGLFVPLVGILAATGLVLYFVGALIAHLRVGSRKLTGWALFFTAELAALIVTIAHRS